MFAVSVCHAAQIGGGACIVRHAVCAVSFSATFSKCHWPLVYLLPNYADYTSCYSTAGKMKQKKLAIL